ncbi:MAG: hypothetical protein IJS53_03980 [Clostridia bacterium]|nr:hypothetical protein [Clostridia bacterium]
MSALDTFRSELRAQLGSQALVRRDRAARALFVTDAPRRLQNAAEVRTQLEQAGYIIVEENGLWRVDLSPARREAFLASLPDCPPPADARARSLCRSLQSRGEPEASLQPWEMVRLTLLLLDKGDTETLFRVLEADAAVRKRLRAPLPTAAARLIALHFEPKEEAESC